MLVSCRRSPIGRGKEKTMKIYGPYTRKDGRQHIVIYENGKHKTISYPKYLLETKLGRPLLPNETCDHIDNDYTNNSLENLQVLTRSDNSKKHVAFNKAEQGYFVCPECNKSFYKSMCQVRHNNVKHKKAGPFCSRSCAGRYGQRFNKTFRGGKLNPGYDGVKPE